MKYAPLLFAALLPALASAIPLPETMAPDFETTAVLPDKDKPEGRIVDNFKLSSLLGKNRVLLLSYPKNCTFICPTELIAIKNKLDQFQELGYEVLVLSTDQASMAKDKEASHQAWRLKSDKSGEGGKDTPIGIGNADFIMLSDPEGKVLKQYGIQNEDGLAFRATFYIGIDGRVRISDVQSNSIGRDVDEILRKAAAVKFIEENEGLVTPEGWQPGDSGMTPDHQGVRKQLKNKGQ
ncbi:redoxin domain-containing protein [Endozoicomonas arenosclerae]|uniref:redoxin domain-containing protein n=1 Tax=Endozoicomonas arenosclerae TaxID=1633495 RepID=UPI000AC82A74|nr:redoxin domain-containing protein [Endozoicomonas arenosclerae]